MTEVPAALAIVLDRTRLLAAESTPLGPTVLGRVLAEDVASDIDSPPYDKSIMDGYAVRSADVQGPVSLTVIEEIAAGRTPTKPVGAGQASRIMTGAPIPDGADAVVPHEETESSGHTVRFQRPTKAGQFVLPRGREMKTGEVVVPVGTVLAPAALGLLAAVGRTDASVYPAARLSIISTGDELVEPPGRPGPGQIRNTNGPMLQALAARAGGVPRYLGIARDDPTVLARLVRDGLDGGDVLVLSGGVSAGKYDFVPEVLRQAGIEAHLHKVRMKPGKPLFFGTRADKLVFGLPGNPLSTFVGFELFVRPALRKLAGFPMPGPTFIPVPLASDLAADNDRPTYAPARLEVTPAGLALRPAAWFGSADLRAFLTADALLQLP
ncbi:MAG TPA: gephyrin-like molybdotransferase Glp, partial [Gemmataceae bacterium]|nr:gephyrin-like molybdotransferase Glp [Gemmataceae bacterium]